jgi:hypothetical protein
VYKLFMFAATGGDETAIACRWQVLARMTPAAGFMAAAARSTPACLRGRSSQGKMVGAM